MVLIVIGEYASKTNLPAEEKVIFHFFVFAPTKLTTPNKNHKITPDPFLAGIAIAVMLLN